MIFKDAGIVAACACNFKSKPLVQKIGIQTGTEQEPEQDMETIPIKIVSETAPLLKKRGKNKKKKEDGIFSNKPKTSGAFPNPDDPLLPAIERKLESTNCDMG